MSRRTATIAVKPRFPFILQNLHRYFLYGAIVFLCFLWYDAIRAFWFPGADQKLHFGIGVGTLVLLVNIILLTLYLLSCHSLRHLIGGKLDCFSCTVINRGRARRVEESQLPQRTPHVVCLVQFDFSWICRLLYPHGGQRHDQGL